MPPRPFIFYDLKYLVDTRFITGENTGLFHWNNGTVIVMFAYHQKQKVKRRNWKAAKQLLSDQYNLPTLSINKAAERSCKPNDGLFVGRAFQQQEQLKKLHLARPGKKYAQYSQLQPANKLLMHQQYRSSGTCRLPAFSSHIAFSLVG